MPDPSEWLLTEAERGNEDTRLDGRHPAQAAWSTGNLVRPLIHGTTYFRALHDALEATGEGDIVLFTDWAGDADQRLTEAEGSEVVEVLARADRRGVAVHGLVWRSHLDQTGFFATENRHLGEQLKRRGVEVLLDMRVRALGSHHQKFVVIRHRDDATRDVAFVGGIDLAHNRRDDAEHRGDTQSDPLTPPYGPHPPWHDVQTEIHGPAVHDVETVFRERWEDPAPLSRAPWRRLADRLHGLDESPDGLPAQLPPPPPAGGHVVQLLRTYPDLRLHHDYSFARGGERSVARGFAKAVRRAQRLVYVEDQYFWGHDVGRLLADRLVAQPELRVVLVIPLFPDVGGINAKAQLLGRRRSIARLMEIAPGRVAAYGLENHAGTPVYVHAKVCVIDDTWTSVGSDNFSRRSWTHDSELSAVVLDEAYARDLRLRLAAEHLDRLGDTMDDCVDAADMFDAYAHAARRLDAWHAAGRQGPRPAGRLRTLPLPRLSRLGGLAAAIPLDTIHDPDGRPRDLRRRNGY